MTKFVKKIAAFITVAAIAVTSIGATAFAVDPIGTDTKEVTEGVEVTDQIPFDVDNRGYDNGGNYKDYTFNVPDDGVMVITYQAVIDHSDINVYREDTSESVSMTGCESTAGEYQSFWKLGWSDVAGKAAANYYFDVKKGNHIIRIRRSFEGFGGAYTGGEGNGRIKFTIEMKKPEPPTGIKASDASSNSVKISWTEPENGSTYDVRYKANGESSWTTKSDIANDNVTLKGLKASTSYSYQVRTATATDGKFASEWSATNKFKTTSAKFTGKLGTPSPSTSVTIKWKAVKNALSYEVRYKVSGAKSWTTKTVETTSYNVSTKSGKKYTYQVRAVNGSNKGSWSKEKTFSA